MPPEAEVVLPAAPAFDAALVARIDAELARRGPGYRPHARHMHRGEPVFTNRMIFETSPYLQASAHHPVNWYPWGDEAFDTARRLGRPVLLSVGRAGCARCAAMDAESFEDIDLAKYLNAHFVAIKVDEPGGGDEPRTEWLSPDRRAFVRGGYYGRDQLYDLLERSRVAFDEQPEQIQMMAAELAAAGAGDAGAL